MQIERAYSRAIVTFALSGANCEVSTNKTKCQKFDLENEVKFMKEINSTCAMPRENVNLYR